jgi:hypothetical protein
LKIAQLLSQYLQENKKLRLQGLGEFTLGGVSAGPTDSEKGLSRSSDETIGFKINSKITEDPQLIDYISQLSGKIKPLASADLDSFLTTGKQLLNISKPFVIEGIGTLSRDAHNEIEFTQGHISVHGEEEHAGKRHRNQNPESSNPDSFGDNYLKPARNYDNGTRKLLIWVAVLAGIAIIAWIGFHFLSTQSESEQTPMENKVSNPQAPPTVPDSSTLASDSLQKTVNDSLAALKTQAPANYSYKIVIETAQRDRALKRYNDLIEWGHRVILTTKDSITFKLAIPIRGPLSDTSRNRDSLTQFFGRKTHVELY